MEELTAEADLGYAGSGRKPPKGVLNWVAQPAPGVEPEAAEVRAPGAVRGRAGRCGVGWGGGRRRRPA